MAVKLHKSGFEYAKSLIEKRRCVLDDRDAWSEHQPSAQQENEFIRRHEIGEYGKWRLGVDIESAAAHLHRMMEGIKAIAD